MFISRIVKQTQTQGKTMVTTKVILWKKKLTENDFLERKYENTIVRVGLSHIFSRTKPYLSMKRCQKTTAKYNPLVCWMVAMSIGTF